MPYRPRPRGTRAPLPPSQLLPVVIALACAGCAAGNRPATAAFEPPALRLQSVATGLPAITTVTNAGDDSDRLFLATQRGQVLELHNSKVGAIPLLDLSAHITCCGERGLLGLAFDPHFRDNGAFYVDYTDTDGASVVARFRLPEGDSSVSPDSGVTLLRVAQPTPIHNGGALAFGPDGLLYIALGDGGHFGNEADRTGNDPTHRAQRLDTLLGKILRIDASAGGAYRIPADNPFVSTAGARPEIWAYGLRNPWRMSFDPATGDLFIADVGPSNWEEINRMPRGSAGTNFGWSNMLGPDCFAEFHCNTRAYTPPILVYDHSSGCAVIGGYRYRGSAIPTLRGVYVFGDFCNGAIRGGKPGTDGRWTQFHLLSTALHISTFGEDEAGELYMADYGDGNGALYRLEPEPADSR